MDAEQKLDAVAAAFILRPVEAGYKLGGRKTGLPRGNTCPRGQLTGYGVEAMMGA